MRYLIGWNFLMIGSLVLVRSGMLGWEKLEVVDSEDLRHGGRIKI